MIRLSLRNKLIAGTAILVLAISVMLAIFVRVVIHTSLEQETHKRALAVARHLSELAVRPLQMGDTVSLQHLVNDNYLMSEDDIDYIFIVNQRGDVLAHSFGSSFPAELLPSLDNKGDGSCLVLMPENRDETICDFAVPIQKGTQGMVHVGLSDQVIMTYVHHVLTLIFPFVILTLVLGTSGAVLFSTVITRPIRKLADGIEKTTRGELSGAIMISSRDEIGMLADSFNRMTDKMRQTTVSREYMEKLLNTMNDVLVVLSPFGEVISVNRAYYELFGSVPTEIIGKLVADFDADQPPAGMYAAFIQSQEDGRVQGIECICRSETGEQIPLLLSLAVMRDDNGEPLAIICAAQDISTIKQVQLQLHLKQAELEGLNQQLEDLVASRTAELAITNEGLRAEVAERKRTAEELLEARDAAEAANKAKTEFLANMSHEMRTPLNSIIGGTEYLEGASLLPDQRRCLEMIQQAGESLLVQVNDLIDLSRIEAGQLELLSKDFNLADLVERVIQMIAPEAERKKVKLSHSLSVDLPHFVVGDRMRLQQVLVNLVGNAIKFTGAGGTVTLSAYVDKNAGDETVPITFVVRDTGIGIEAGKINMIFEAFAQADSSITRRFGGSGLGLSISRRLVEAMGGNIRAESQPGVGSSFTFTVLLPIAKDALPEAVREARLPAGNERTTSALKNTSDQLPLVLLVDDSLENRELLRLLMSRQPLQLHEAANGQEALDLFEHHEYALVLMDIQMPVMDGYTATRLMRKADERLGRRRTPVIALTAHAYEADIRRCLEAG